MLGFKLNHGLKFLDGLVEMSQVFLRQPELKIQGGHRRVNLLRFLERLDCLFDLV